MFFISCKILNPSSQVFVCMNKHDNRPEFHLQVGSNSYHSCPIQVGMGLLIHLPVPHIDIFLQGQRLSFVTSEVITANSHRHSLLKCHHHIN